MSACIGVQNILFSHFLPTSTKFDTRQIDLLLSLGHEFWYFTVRKKYILRMSIGSDTRAHILWQVLWVGTLGNLVGSCQSATLLKNDWGATLSEVIGPVLTHRADDIHCCTAISDGPRSAVGSFTSNNCIHLCSYIELFRLTLSMSSFC